MEIEKFYPIYLDISVHLEGEDGVVDQSNYIFEGDLNDLFYSHAFKYFFEDLRIKTGVAYLDPFEDIGKFLPNKLDDLFETVKVYKSNIQNGEWKIQKNYKYHSRDGEKVEEKVFKKRDLLIVVQKLLDLIEVAKLEKKSVVFTGP